MLDTVAPRFLAALRAAAIRHLAAGDACLAAIDAAVRDPGPAAAVAVQEAMACLAPEVREAILRDTHRALVLDPAATLGAWTPPRGTAH